jgi:hypothetical protein
MDYAHMKKRNLFIAGADVFKAFDSVPIEGNVNSLRRIKTPEDLI